MNIKRQLFVLIAAAASLTAAAQQTVNTKMGKPTEEEMQMTTYAHDSTAEAVVLCRLSDVNYTVQFHGYLVDYKERIRIKVLKPGGERFATVVVPFYKMQHQKSHIKVLKFSTAAGSTDMLEGSLGSFLDDASDSYVNEDVQDLKAVAFNMVDGKMKKTVMSKDSIKEEKVDDWTSQLRFTIPDVRVGTVIEYEYTIHSQLFYMLRDWYPQCEIPVQYAFLDMDIPTYLIFNVEEKGIQRLSYRCVTGALNYKLESDPLARPITIPTNHYTFMGQNLRAMPKLPFVWSTNDYNAGMTADLKSFSLRGTLQMEYASTWEQIDEMLQADEDLGQQARSHSPLKDQLEAAGVKDIADEQLRAVAVVKEVMKRVNWDGTYAIWPQKTEQTLKNGSGSNADINMLLIQSLRDAGLEAVPVVLRKRDEGLLPHNFPSIMKLTSYVVGIVQPSGTINYIDASTALDGSFNVLPEVMQVERARALLKNGGKWVNLQQLPRAQKKMVINATLSPDGLLSGTQTTVYQGAELLHFRQALRTGGSNGMKEQLARRCNMQIDGYEVEHADDFTPTATENVTFSRRVKMDSGVISFCPFNAPPMETNPFSDWQQRIVPIEFPGTETEQITVNITLPEGYTLRSKPEPVVATTADKGANGRVATSLIDNRVQVVYQFSINKPKLQPNAYPALRQMYDMFTNCSRMELSATPIK